MKRKPSESLINKWNKAFKKENHNHEASEPVLTLIKKEPVTFQLSRLKNQNDFEKMCFVIKACEKKSDSSFRSVLHVEQSRTGSRLIATDGHRLHVAEISKKIKSGNYKPHVAKNVISLGKPLENIKFPAWVNAIPENVEKRGVISLTHSGMGSDKKETEKLSIAFNSLASQTGESVNLRYLDDLTKHEWTVYCQNGKHKVIVLREKNGKIDDTGTKGPLAVILPIKEAA
jgi:hypothetical protein